MPAPVPPWTQGTFPGAKSLVEALYSSDGSGDHPSGVAFHSQRPILFEAYNRTATLPTAAGGTQTALSTSGTTTAAWPIYDTAGYFGMYSDQPGLGYYQFLAAVKGSAGDGQTPGGWSILAHFAPIVAGSTQTSVSADMTGTAQTPVSGTRQAPASGLDSCPFFCDLVNTPGGTGGIVWSPAVTIADSASANAHNAVNTTDSSGETPRFLALWAAVSATTSGQAVFNVGGTYPFTAPLGVTQVTEANTGAGAGGGGGNSSGGGIEYGAGGGGAGQWATGTVPVTPGNNYVVVVGTGGAGGTGGSGATAATAGAAGGSSTMAGDSGSVTGHGGSGGAAATTSGDGAGGAGGTGGSGTRFDGGAGATGVTGQFGGGGGSSGGTGQAGQAAMGSAGAPAVPGGGPGGPGGAAGISVVQSASGQNNGQASLTVKFGAPIQPGNAVIAATIYQAKPATNPGSYPDAQLALNDGTPLAPTANADNTNISVNMQLGLYEVGGVTGGQTSVTMTGFGSTKQGDYRAMAVQMWEVTGLGPSPQTDANASAEVGGGTANQNTYPPSGTTSPPANDAPDFWVGVAGGQWNMGSFSIHSPASSQGWTTFPGGQLRTSKNGIDSALLAAYQVKTATGTVNYSGTFSDKVSVGWIAASYATSALTTGSAPVTPPGGGGGGGLGASNNGGNGDDGQVILTWTGASGSGYGTPATPAPYTGWTNESTIGTTSVPAPDVNVNSSAGIAGVLNFLSNPPAVRVSAQVAQSVNSATLTNVAFSGVSATVDSYAGWNPSTGTYTVARPGLYLFHGLACFAANSAGTRRAGVTINGTTYWGPPSIAPSTGTCNVAKTQIFSLQAGDTVQLACRHTAGSALALDTGNQTRFFLTWLGLAGIPASIWSPPDITFRWATGTPGADLPADFQLHLANDLGFLTTRPYFLGYQQTAQTGLTTGAFATLTMDTTTGLIHSTDVGDNYGGWVSGGSNKYVSQASGWYLAVFEGFTAAATSSPAMVTAGLLASTSGGRTPHTTPDYYQALSASTLAGTGGGAAAISAYYLAQGESLTPQLMASATGFGATFATQTGLQNGGDFWPHLELVWMSE